MWENEKKAEADSVKRTFKQVMGHRRVIDHSYFLGYLLARIKQAPLYTQWQELLTSFRRIRLLARLLKLLGFFFTVVETGTLVILSTALLLVILPVLALLMTAILLTAWIKSHHSNKVLSRALTKTTVVITFPRVPIDGFQLQNLRDLAARGYTVLLISPRWLSSAGIRPSPFYLTFRREEKNLYLIRPYYFFSLRKRVLRSKKQIWIF